jgi:hypothetical protein
MLPTREQKHVTLHQSPLPHDFFTSDFDQRPKKSGNASSSRTQSAPRAPDAKLSAPSTGTRALPGLPPKDVPLPKPPVPGVNDGGLKPLLGAFVELHAGRTVTC